MIFSTPLGCCLGLLSLTAILAPAEARAAGKSYALLVGVRDYDSSKLNPLKYTENDVEELGKLLSGKDRFARVRLLTTTRGKARKADAPTLAGIRAALKSVLEKKTRNDTVLVALSGHGLALKVPDGQQQREESFFCPADAQLNDAKTLLSLQTLFTHLQDCGAGVKLVLVDACRTDPGEGRSLALDAMPRPACGLAALFSCKSGERAFETPKLGKGHGVFFHYVLQGLGGAAKNAKGEVTWSALADYVTEKVADDVPLLIGGGARQTPQEIKNLTGKSPVLLQAPRLSSEAKKLFRLARKRRSVEGKRLNPAEVAQLYREAADQGHPLARGFLGILHAQGSGVKKDEEQARRLCREAVASVKQAAVKGDPVAQALLGNMYRLGAGVDRDEKEAIRWMREAADKDLAEAQNLLGVMYKKGQGVPKSLPEALRWFRKAVTKNHSGAQTNLARMYELGLGVEKDAAEAVRLYRLAAEKNDTMAQSHLGVMYMKGRGGLPKDYAEAVRLYRLAAGKGYTRAKNRLGWMYQKGWGVEKNYSEAFRWYREAAAEGHTEATYHLGSLYENGRGVKRNLAEARKWYQKAAEQGNVKAQKRLDRMKGPAAAVPRRSAVS